MAKRVFDVVIGSLALAIAALPMAVVAAVVRITMGSPVFFHQLRPGLHGELFTLHKFRTMKAGTAPDAERLTKVGRFLRSSSLDELPEL